MIAELFQNDLLLIMKNGNYKDYSDYFSALFNRQENFNEALVDDPYYGKYSPDRHSGSMKTRSFPMVNGVSWTEFQNWLDSAYTLAKPISFLNGGLCSSLLSSADFATFIGASGIYKRPISSGNSCTSEIPNPVMTASDGTVLAHGLIQDSGWEFAYNTILIPYERSIKSAGSGALRYIKNLVQYGDQAHYYRTSTWKFDGTSL